MPPLRCLLALDEPKEVYREPDTDNLRSTGSGQLQWLLMKSFVFVGPMLLLPASPDSCSKTSHTLAVSRSASGSRPLLWFPSLMCPEKEVDV